MDEGPCAVVRADAPAEELGRAVRVALDASRSPIPHPTSWGGINEALLSAAGVKTWATFAKSARCVNVEQTDRIEVRPTGNGGSQAGFVTITEKIERLALPLDEPSVGEAVRRAVSASS